MIHALSPARQLSLAVLLLVAALTPSLFWLGCVEVFDTPKSLFLVAAGAVLAALALSEGRRALPTDAISLAVGAGLVIAALSSLTSVSPRLSILGHLESQGGLLTLAALAAVYLATRLCVQSREQAAALVAALAVATALAAGYGMAQALSFDPVPWQGRSDFAGWYRPGGTEGHAIKLGGLLATTLPLLFWLGGVRGKWVAGSLILLTLAVLPTLLARGAWLGVAAAGVAALALAPRPAWLTWTRALLGVAALAGLIAASGAGLALVHRVAGMGDSSSRLYIYETAWKLFLDRPILGWGPETFQLAFGLHRNPEYWALEWGRTPSRAHNELLHLLATQGVLGAGAYLALVALVARAGWVALSRPGQDRGLVITLLASVAAYQAQLLTGFSAPGSAATFAIACALLARLSEGPLEARTPFPAGRALLPAVALLAWLSIAGNIAAYVGLGFKAWVTVSWLAVLAGLAAWAFRPSPLGEESSVERECPGTLPYYRLAGALLAVVLLAVRPAVALGFSWHPALEARDESVRWAPELPELWTRLAAQASQEALQRPADGPRLRARAVQAMREGALRVPACPETQGQLGKALLEQARAGEASLDDVLAAYDGAIVLDPRNVVLMRDAARAALAMGQEARAEPYLEEALRIGPRHPTILAEAAAVAFARGRLDQARSMLAETFEMKWADDCEGLSRARGLYALVQLQRNEFADALRVAQDLARERPDWPVALVIQGMALEGLGKPKEARAAYSQALALEPGNVAALAGMRRAEAQKPKLY
jgi:O-antigen ligase/tetratricopeptide (TPR) repeat protein